MIWTRERERQEKVHKLRLNQWWCLSSQVNNVMYTSLRRGKLHKQFLLQVWAAGAAMDSLQLLVSHSLLWAPNPQKAISKKWLRWPKKLVAIFVIRPIKPLGNIFRTQKANLKNLCSSRSFKSLKFEFVCAAKFSHHNSDHVKRVS